MNSDNLSINLIQDLETSVLHNGRYHYSYNKSSEDLKRNLSGLKDFIIYSLVDGQKLRVDNETFNLNQHEYLVIQNKDVEKIDPIKITHTLLSGSVEPENDESFVRKMDLEKTKVVSKPWGRENWLKGIGGRFSFKYIVLNSGFQTSLQYHLEKEETNFLYEGTAELHFCPHDIPSDKVTTADVEYKKLDSKTFVHVKPPAVHRLKSLKTLHLFETSTPELDDVVRIQDDSNRKDGRIESEHSVPPLCILTAGEGTRLLPLTETINKSLVPIGERPAISYILEKTVPGQEVVVALGHKGDLVEDYLKTFYSDFKFSFIYVNDYNGKDSGPGKSLFSCKEKLQRPFYYVACDTLWSKNLRDLPSDKSWIGTSDRYNNKEIFCNVEIKSGEAVSFINKRDTKKQTEAFVGLGFVKEYESFWKCLESALSKKKTDIYHAYDEIVSNNQLSAITVEWSDVGNFENIEKHTLHKYNFSKPDEFIWFDRDKVIKLFKNNEVLNLKYLRSQKIQNFIPEGINKSENFLYYNFFPAKTFYKSYSDEAFKKLLDQLQNKFWKNLRVSQGLVTKNLEKFYIKKTRDRISLFKKKYGNWSPKKVNGNSYYSYEDKLLKSIRQKMNKYSSPTVFHGDLQFDNILFADDEFKLIDWRESFGGQSDWGDLYYDLAKMYGGLIVNYSLIKEDRFSYEEKAPGEISFSLDELEWQQEARRQFEYFIAQEGHDLEFIKVLTSLIYLNMAPLHHYPFDKLLYSLSFEVFHELSDESE